ncbi:hypothetical protein B0H19DRAFT_1060066 [Mycena capillaripes]|nr:hypothetical protein B0H19DRAFT_1060066 [Mycena capillaripes]
MAKASQLFALLGSLPTLLPRLRLRCDTANFNGEGRESINLSGGTNPSFAQLSTIETIDVELLSQTHLPQILGHVFFVMDEYLSLSLLFKPLSHRFHCAQPCYEQVGWLSAGEAASESRLRNISSGQNRSGHAVTLGAKDEACGNLLLPTYVAGMWVTHGTKVPITFVAPFFLGGNSKKK